MTEEDDDKKVKISFSLTAEDIIDQYNASDEEADEVLQRLRHENIESRLTTLAYEILDECCVDLGLERD